MPRARGSADTCPRGRRGKERGRARRADEDQPDEHRSGRGRSRADGGSTPPAIPSAKPVTSTGTRPKRSMARPAGSAKSAPVPRTIAGPSPTRLRTPTTRTTVSVATAAESCSIAEFAASEAREQDRVAARQEVQPWSSSIKPAREAEAPRESRPRSTMNAGVAYGA
jgi:hypothetical protein